MGSLRLFIAINLPDGTRESLAQLQGQLKHFCPTAKWVEPQNLHLTLKFLGTVEQEKIIRISSVIGAVAKTQASFDIQLGGTGAFPRMNDPRIIWIGLKQGTPEIVRMAAELQTRLAIEGFPADPRGFSPHLTVARLKDRAPIQLVEALKAVENWLDVSPISVYEICLMSSELSRRGPRYDVVEAYQLSRDPLH